ncbi:hypothetical protein B0H14DRAFT_3012901 [Mycena olivaceomarginata]|nr:hypothetical protein B0H14DRAFT_3012901 [Mycena olivaceomarginata]
MPRQRLSSGEFRSRLSLWYSRSWDSIDWDTFWAWCLYATMGLGIVGFLAWVYEENIKISIAVQKQLVSRITSDTPISGFYGPGAWCAFLVTLGMSHGRTGLVLLRTGEAPSDWDYDLMGASAYSVFAAVDLILKSRAIAELGDKAAESMLIPAFICAECVVFVGTGSSLFTLFLNIPWGPATEPHRSHSFLPRVANGLAMAVLVLAVVATGFCFHAHRVVCNTHTVPGIWCGADLRGAPLYTFDFLASTVVLPFFLLVSFCLARTWWYTTAVACAVVIPSVFLISLLWKRNLRGALKPSAFSAMMVLSPSALYIFGICGTAVAFVGVWIVFWGILGWLPIYTLSFFPQLAFFPPTAISAAEMDQIAALSGTVLVAATRTLRHIYAAVHPSLDSWCENTHLLPLSSRDDSDNP